MMQKQQVRYCVSVQDHRSGVPVCARVCRCGQCHVFFTVLLTSSVLHDWTKFLKSNYLCPYYVFVVTDVSTQTAALCLAAFIY